MTFLSPDGICHSFDHRANGYARGDGIGGMVLKTLKQAVADGDTIRAVIRNSGLGQDGRTPGITMPSPQAHADLITSTYAEAGLSLDQTSYFEAHGRSRESHVSLLLFNQNQGPERQLETLMSFLQSEQHLVRYEVTMIQFTSEA